MADAPRDLEAEQIVLALILMDDKAIHIVSDMLQESDFFAEHYRMAYRSILSLQKEGVAIDPWTLKAELQRRGEFERFGGMPALANLTDGVARASNAKHYCSIVRRTSVLRSLMQLAGQIHAQAAAQQDGPQELIERIQGQLMGFYGRYQESGLKPISEIARTGFSELEERKKHRDGYGLKTGFYDIDRIIGGFRPGNLIILAARPGGGKSAMAVNMATYIACAGKRVAIFSVEMSNTELYFRMIGAEAQISIGSLLGGYFHKDHWLGIADASDRISKQSIQIDDSGSLNTDQLWARCKRAAADGGLDLIIVDYLQLLGGPGKSLYEKVTNISRELKKLAKDLKCPVIALSQLHRLEKETDEPQLSDLRESGAIEQDADVVMFLWAGQHEGVRKCKIAKQRNGPIGTFDIGFDAEQTRFFTCTQNRD
jgi:replicative DNA helicase